MADDKQTVERWTVRAVPAEVQERAAQAAREAGMKLGPWLSSVILAHLDRPGSQSAAERQTAPAEAADIGEVQRRLTALERDVSTLFAALPGRQMAAAPRPPVRQMAATGSQKSASGSQSADKIPDARQPNGSQAADGWQTDGSQTADKPRKPGPTTRVLPPEVAEKVLELVREGLGTRTIAARLEVTRDQVTGVIRRAERSGELSRQGEQ